MFVGYSGRTILWASTERGESTERVRVLEVPSDPGISNEEILRDYIVRRDKVIHRDAPIPSKELKVAMVSPYGINCGIATYTKQLCDQIRPLVEELRIFAENAEEKNDSKDEADNVVRCWERGGDYIGIIRAIEEYNPDVVYVQHEYGSFNNGSKWNTLIGHLNAKWRTVVTLHSVYDHFDKLVFEAPCQEIIVHSETARTLLRARGITHSTINYVPHGCLPLNQISSRFSDMKSGHVIFQYGFGFEYKGWENALSVVEKLKDQYDDLLYIGIFNVSKYSVSFHNSYYDKLMEAVRVKGLEKHFVLHKGYRSEAVINSYMSQAQVNLFPYWNHHEWKVHGASGAVRMALASGIPTILGDVPFFSEFRGVVPICSTVEEYANSISMVFESQEYRDAIRKQTVDFLEHRTWDKIAKWYLECNASKELSAV